jgi:putative endonuclease
LHKQGSRNLGQGGEACVAQWLEQNGYKVLAQNFRTRHGEVDLIATKKKVVAFVEVKTRKHEYFPIAQVVTLSKQRKIIAAAKAYIVEHELEGYVFRFDVAAVLALSDKPLIDYIEDAFREGS